MTDKKITLNQKQEFVAKKIKDVLFKHSLVLETLILELKDNDKDFAMHLQSLSDKEFTELYAYFGIEGGIVKQPQTNLLLARLGLDVLEDDFVEQMPSEKAKN